MNFEELFHKMRAEGATLFMMDLTRISCWHRHHKKLFGVVGTEPTAMMQALHDKIEDYDPDILV